MNKKLKYLLVSMVLMFAISLPNQVFAATEHRLSLSGVICPMDNYANETGDDKYYACMDDYLAGNLTETVSSGDKVKPGSTVMVILNYSPGDSMNVISLNATIRYDSTKWTPLHQNTTDFFDTDAYPKKGRNTKWQPEMNVRGPGDISFYIEDSTDWVPLTQDTELYYTFMQLNESVGSNEDITLTLGDEPGDVDFSDENGDQVRPYALSNMTLTSPAAAQSSDATLKTLTVMNGSTTYPLDPTFTPGDATNTSYNAIVPNNITSVDLAATTNDGGATILSAGLGTKTVNVGNNDFDIVVTAANGATETYTVSVYRLSNDATLSSLSLTNSISIGSLQTGKYTYTATVPYETTSTTVSATATHTNATVKSGTGAWNLTNTGATKNTKIVKVEAENCKTAYASVPGNSCTDQDYTIEITREAASNNNFLSDLTVDGTTVPGFIKTTKTYTLSDVSNSKTTMTIGATVEDTGKATIKSGTGTVNLSVGNNSFNVVVKAQDGTEETYTINVKRLSNDIKLASLSITSTPQGTMSPSFSASNTTGYTYSYDATVTQVTVTATVADTGKAQVAIVDTTSNPSAIGTPQLNTATVNFGNTVTSASVIVTAEDGTVQTYPITFARSQSDNKFLSSLSINPGILNETFVKTTFGYTATVASNVDSVTVTAVPEDAPRATIKSITGNTNLTFGTNTITVTVKAENGDEQPYTITLTREKSNVATLEDLTIDGTTVTGFNKNTFIYTIPGSVAYNKTSVTIGTVKTDANSTVTGDGTVNLDTGSNTIIVKVTAQNGVDFKEYKINIERDKNSDNTVHGLTVAGKTPTLNSEGNYEVTLPNGQTTLDPADVVVSVGDGATVTKGNAISLVTTGVNTYEFTVESESGDSKTYTVLVTREASTSTTLSKVTLNIGSDSSRSCIMSGDTCTITIPADTTDFTLTTEIPATSKVSPVDGTPHTMAVTESSKNITLTVTAEDGTTTKDYTLVVEREKSTINTLDSVSITSDGTEVGTWNQTFAPGTNSYTVNVSGNIASIHVSATLTDTRATIVSGTGDYSLNVGDGNTVTIRVRSESGAFNDYTIKVVRAEKTDNDLTDLTVDGTTVPGFDKDTLEYTLTNVPNSKTSIVIGATKSDTDATMTGTGNKILQTGLNTFEVTVKAQNGDTKTYTIKITRNKNDEARLSSLTISGQTLDPTFDRDTFDYEITVDETKATLSPNEVTAIPVDNNATVVKDAALTLSTTTDNFYEINVTAEDGNTTKTYTIKVIRPKSTDATLSNVTVTGGSLSPNFVPADENYKITLPIGTTSFTISATPNVPTTTVNGEGTYTLADSPVQITTRAEDGVTTKTYTFTIEEAKSNDATLASLSVTDHTLTPTFVPADETYSIGNVIYGTTQLEINATPTNLTSTVEYIDTTGTSQTSNMISIPNTLGANSVKVKVTAADGTTEKTYTINYTVVMSDNAFLSSLTINNGTLDPGFDKETLEYTVNVDRTVTSMDVTATTEDSTATLQVNGTAVTSPYTLSISPLASGETVVTILVTAQDGTVKTYKVTINRENDIPDRITSVAFGHIIDSDFIRTVKLATIGSEMKNQLDNDNQYLEIWTADESAQVTDTDTLATGMIVKLIIDNQEKDRKDVVIKGDTSGDGEIDLFDAVIILNHYLKFDSLNGAYLESAYVNDDTDIDLFDSVLILNHYLKFESIH